jgi:hypothetical protein
VGCGHHCSDPIAIGSVTPVKRLTTDLAVTMGVSASSGSLRQEPVHLGKCRIGMFS